MTDNVLDHLADDLESRASEALDGGEAWPEPQPLPNELLPVEPFNLAMLPSEIRPWVADIAERMQCPVDFVAVAAMVALSSVIGRKCALRPKRHDDWRVFPNCWGAVVGRPATMKSPSIAEALRPLDRLVHVAEKDFESKKADFDIQARIAELAKKHADGDVEKAVKAGNLEEAKRLAAKSAGDAVVVKPVCRRYKVVNSSVEALGAVLIENPNGVLAYRDELSSLLRSLDKEGQEDARGFYLQGYDASQGYTFDRIMRGSNLRIPAVCLSLFGGIQPGLLRDYIHRAVEGGIGDDGLLQRFALMVYPDVSREFRNVDRYPDTEAKNRAFDVFQRLSDLPTRTTDDGEQEPEIFRFDDDAQEAFDDWRSALMIRLKKGELHPAIESHLMKYTKAIPAIALICTLVDQDVAVNLAALNRALAWSEYLESHAMRIYNMGLRPAVTGAKAMLRKIHDGAIKNGFKAADVYLKGWANLATTKDALEALALLVDLNYLRRVDQQSGERGGRPSTTYLIHPSLLPGGA